MRTKSHISPHRSAPSHSPATNVVEMPLRTSPPQLLTVPEVMEALRLGRSTVYDLIRTGAIPSLLVRNRRRIPSSALSTYIAHQLKEAC